MKPSSSVTKRGRSRAKETRDTAHVSAHHAHNACSYVKGSASGPTSSNHVSHRGMPMKFPASKPSLIRQRGERRGTMNPRSSELLARDEPRVIAFAPWRKKSVLLRWFGSDKSGRERQAGPIPNRETQRTALDLLLMTTSASMRWSCNKSKRVKKAIQNRSLTSSPSSLTSNHGFAGCFPGDLEKTWSRARDERRLYPSIALRRSSFL